MAIRGWKLVLRDPPVALWRTQPSRPLSSSTRRDAGAPPRNGGRCGRSRRRRSKRPPSLLSPERP